MTTGSKITRQADASVEARDNSAAHSSIAAPSEAPIDEPRAPIIEYKTTSKERLMGAAYAFEDSGVAQIAGFVTAAIAFALALWALDIGPNWPLNALIQTSLIQTTVLGAFFVPHIWSIPAGLILAGVLYVLMARGLYSIFALLGAVGLTALGLVLYVLWKDASLGGDEDKIMIAEIALFFTPSLAVLAVSRLGYKPH